MNKELKRKMIEKARENGSKYGKKAELDFGAGAEWMYEQLQNFESQNTFSDQEIWNWLKEQNYQTDYEETGEYKMYYYMDMPSILKAFFKYSNARCNA
jgi:hypothetical protein